MKGAATGAAVGVVTSGGTLSGADAVGGCVGGIGYDYISRRYLSGAYQQAGEAINGVKDVVDVFSHLLETT